MTDTKINDRRFYKAQQEADFADQQLSTPQTPKQVLSTGLSGH